MLDLDSCSLRFPTSASEAFSEGTPLLAMRAELAQQAHVNMVRALPAWQVGV